MASFINMYGCRAVLMASTVVLAVGLVGGAYSPNIVVFIIFAGAVARYLNVYELTTIDELISRVY